MTADEQYREVWELLETVRQARARVRQCVCTCTKGKGVTRKQRRYCDRCQAHQLLRSVRQTVEDMKARLRRAQRGTSIAGKQSS